jgi:hypothetical protein
MSEASGWRRCSACKEPIGFGALYWVCSVSTCNRKRTGMVFCTPDCWEVHLPTMNHREAWAVEKTAPATAAEAEAAAADKPAAKKREPQRRIVRPEPAKPAPGGGVPDEVLIVASRLKAYVLACSGMNTSDRVLDPLSDHVREIVDRAIENARRDGRKTVLDRDVPGA